MQLKPSSVVLQNYSCVNDAVVSESLTMPATALPLHVLLGLASFAWQAANRFRGLRLIEFKLDVVHFDVQPAVLVLADFHPLILSLGCLFKVNYVVSRRAISVRVKIKLITGDNNSLYRRTIA